MLLETFKNFPDFELLDTGDGFRLERWGQVHLQRPDPQIIWQRSLPDAEWNKAHAIFRSASGEDKGRWDIKKQLPDQWVIGFPLSHGQSGDQVKFLLKLSPFKHTGLFAEQAANWEFMIERLKNRKIEKLKILNLFGYTGGATMVLAAAGCQVTHVDASKPAITWANENYRLNFGDAGNGLDRSPEDGSRPVPTETPAVRWILDDAAKFVSRELKRGNTYDGIIMDPPAFGHSPSGKTWKFNKDLPRLLADCMMLLSENARFLVVNGYATNSSALALNNLLEDATKQRGGTVEAGELCLKQKTDRMISTGIFARWKK